MSTPVTLSGFNGIDFGSIVTALMAEASQPLTALQTQESSIKSQISNFQSLSTTLGTMQDAATALSDPSSYSAFSATSTNPSAVQVTSSGDAVAGHYDVVVNELARAQVTASNTTSPDSNTTAVATGGTLTINGVDVNISGSTTLQQLASAINSTSGVGVTASVVRASSAAYRLVLTGSTTGEAGAFTVVNNLTGGAGVGFTDTDANGISGDSAADNAVNATDASITANNVTATSTTNEFDGVIPGVTFTVSAKDPSATVGVDVTADGSTLKTQLNDFISAYNDVVSFFNTQTAAAASNDPTSIANQPIVRQFHNEMRSVINGVYGSGAISQLAQVGVEFTQTGTLQLNETTFDNALATDPADVKTVLNGPTGGFGAIENMINEYTEGGGVLSTTEDQLTNETKSLDSQISDMQGRLAIQQQSLQAEFTAADTAMSQLNSQAGSFASASSSIGGSSLTSG